MAGHAVNRFFGHAVLLTFLCACLSAPVQAAPAQRVVSTNLCTDEYVFRLVPRDHIAALSYEATDRHPVVSTIADQAKDIRTIHPSAETILTLHPDLVVIYAGTETRLRAALMAEHIPVLDVPWDNSLADIRRTTKMLGQKLGAPQRAAALIAQMDRKLNAVKKQAPARPVKVLFYQPNGYVRSGLYVDQILSFAGGRDIAADFRLSRTGTVPVERILLTPPDLLILGNTTDNAMAARPLHHPALRTLKHTVITTLDTHALLCPGPWAAGAAGGLSRLVRRAAALRPAVPGPTKARKAD